ncbi:Ferric uptake regulator, Fur family [Hyphomicrobium sp. MC1]|nr:Ferric uptake regulator, Fur family [Hyphomicrobium sp. MC1]
MAAILGRRGIVFSQSLIVMTAPSAKSETSIEKRCTEYGLRMTGQRRVIAQVLSAATDHPDVEEVHRRVVAVDARISLSTVYRTLKLFSEKGILERHDFGHGRGRYEPAPREHHDHLVDIETGRVIEFSNSAIEALQERVARELGFELVGHRLELYGVPLGKKKSSARRG